MLNHKRICWAVIATFLVVLSIMIAPKTIFAQEAQENKAPMRMTINNENPLLLSPLYGNDESNGIWWNNTLEGAWNAIPEDIKPHAAIELHPAKVCKPTSCIPRDSETLRAWYVSMLDKAQELNIPVFLVIMSAGERNTVPVEWLDAQFAKYSVLKGVLNIENYWIYNDQLAPHSADYLKVCAKYGGYFIWHDHQVWFWETVLNDQSFFDACKKYHKNLILATKNTPITDDPGTDSIVSGAWLSGLCDNWGASTDTWKWWEKHYTNVFETGRPRDMRSYASEPEAMIAMEMMNVYTGGGTVYNFECAAYTFMTNDVPTPAFTKGIVPFFRHVLANPAPTKEEVINRSKVVFWNGEGRFSAISRGFYNGLNSVDHTMPLYTTGRYHIMPVIVEKMTREEVERIFPQAEIVTKRSSELGGKTAFFNSKYPELYTGTGYAQRVGNWWYAYNSAINVNTDQTVNLPMYVNNTQGLKIDFTPHTYAMVKEDPAHLTVSLNNYRTDKTEMWNVAGDFHANKSWKAEELVLARWISEHLSTNTPDNEMRTTTLTFTGITNQPQITITGDQDHYRVEQAYNEQNHELVVTVRHNGLVTLSLDTEGTGPVALPEADEYDPSTTNLAFAKEARQSSTAYGGDASRAVDGNTDGNFGHNSVTHTSEGGNNPWWEVDLGKTHPIAKVVIYNRTDTEPQRLSNFDVVLLDANNAPVHRQSVDRLEGPSIELAVPSVEAQKVRVELKKNATPLSLAEVEVYSPKKPAPEVVPPVETPEAPGNEPGTTPVAPEPEVPGVPEGNPGTTPGTETPAPQPDNNDGQNTPEPTAPEVQPGNAEDNAGDAPVTNEAEGVVTEVDPTANPAEDANQESGSSNSTQTKPVSIVNTSDPLLAAELGIAGLVSALSICGIVFRKK